MGGPFPFSLLLHLSRQEEEPREDRSIPSPPCTLPPAITSFILSSLLWDGWLGGEVLC